MALYSFTDKPNRYFFFATEPVVVNGEKKDVTYIEGSPNMKERYSKKSDNMVVGNGYHHTQEAQVEEVVNHGCTYKHRLSDTQPPETTQIQDKSKASVGLHLKAHIDSQTQLTAEIQASSKGETTVFTPSCLLYC